MLTSFNALKTFALLAVVPMAFLCGGPTGHKKLTWKDFQGTPPSDNPGPEKAEISLDLEIDYGIEVKPVAGGGAKATITDGVQAVVDTATSWVIQGEQTPELLEHEQYHFDLHYFWATAINTALGSLCATAPTGQAALDKADAAAQSIINAGFAGSEAIQVIYDLDTDHGTDPVRQAWWCGIVGLWLNPRIQDGSSTGAVGGGKVDGGTSGGGGGGGEPNPPKLRLPEVQSGRFDSPAGGGEDAELGAMTWRFPSLNYEGLFMGTQARLFSQEGQRTVTLGRAGDDPVLTGELMHVMGSADGLTYRGWISPVAIDGEAVTNSPYLAVLADELHERRVLTVEIRLTQTVESLSENWTQSAVVPMDVRIGTAEFAHPSDVNFDGALDANDALPFYELLNGNYPQLFPWAGDANGDGQVDLGDVDAFLEDIDQG